MLTPYSIESLKGIQKWGKWVGILSIIFGALSAISGIFLFIVGAAPGVFMILSGVALLNAAKNAEKLALDYNEQEANNFFENLKKSLKYYGIYYIISFVLFLLIMIFYGFLFATLLSSGFY